jgi:hypothetical protein
MIKLKEKKKLKNNISKKLKKIRKNLWDQSKKGFNYFSNIYFRLGRMDMTRSNPEDKIEVKL